MIHTYTYVHDTVKRNTSFLIFSYIDYTATKNHVPIFLTTWFSRNRQKPPMHTKDHFSCSLIWKMSLSKCCFFCKKFHFERFSQPTREILESISTGQSMDKHWLRSYDLSLRPTSAEFRFPFFDDPAIRNWSNLFVSSFHFAVAGLSRDFSPWNYVRREEEETPVCPWNPVVTVLARLSSTRDNFFVGRRRDVEKSNVRRSLDTYICTYMRESRGLCNAVGKERGEKMWFHLY